MRPIARVRLLSLITCTLSGYVGYTQNPISYEGATWPSEKKPTPVDYQLTREQFLQRYGVNDSAVAIIRMYYYQYQRGQRLATRRKVTGIPAFNDRPNEGAAMIGDRKVKFWHPAHLYSTLYEFRTLHKLPSAVVERLPVYLERLHEPGAITDSTQNSD